MFLFWFGFFLLPHHHHHHHWIKVEIRLGHHQQKIIIIIMSSWYTNFFLYSESSLLSHWNITTTLYRLYYIVKIGLNHFFFFLNACTMVFCFFFGDKNIRYDSLMRMISITGIICFLLFLAQSSKLTTTKKNFFWFNC